MKRGANMLCMGEPADESISHRRRHSPVRRQTHELSPRGEVPANDRELREVKRQVELRRGPLFSAPVTASGTTFEPGKPQQVLIFPVLNVSHSGGDYHPYAVSPDGERFLIPQFAVTTDAGGGSAQLGPDQLSGLTVAVNWTASLGK